MKPLYPTAKTKAQRDQEDAERVIRQRQRLPKLPWLTIPLAGGAVAWALLQFMRITPQMWAAESSAYIFFTFAMWLFIVALFIAWVFHVNKTLYAHGRPLITFWVGFVVALMVTIGVYVSGVIPSVENAALHLSYVAGIYTVTLLVVTVFAFFGGLFLKKKAQ